MYPWFQLIEGFYALTFKGERPCSVSLSPLGGRCECFEESKKRSVYYRWQNIHILEALILSQCSRQGGLRFKSASLDQNGYSDSVAQARGFILSTEVKGQPFRAAGEGRQNSYWNINSSLLQTFLTYTWRRMTWGIFLHFRFKESVTVFFWVEWKKLNAELHIANEFCLCSIRYPVIWNCFLFISGVLYGKNHY